MMIKATLVALGLLLTAPAMAEEVPTCNTVQSLEAKMLELNGEVDPKPVVIEDLAMVQSFIAYVSEKLGPPPGDVSKVIKVVSWDLKDGTFATVFFRADGCQEFGAKLSLDFLMGWDPVDPA